MRAGLDVTFIEQWPAHAEAMDERGLGRHAGRDFGHTCSRCAQWRFWRRLDQGRRGEREDINGLSSCGSSCRAPVNEALIAARIEGGALSALPSDADLQSLALGAWGGLCK